MPPIPLRILVVHHRLAVFLWACGPLGCCVFTGPWRVTRSSLGMLRRVGVFWQPLRPVFLLVSLPRQRRPVISTGVVLIGVGVILRFLLPTPLHTQVIHPMPRRFAVCMQPNTSTPPSGVLVVHHMPPRHVGLLVGSVSIRKEHGGREGGGGGHGGLGHPGEGGCGRCRFGLPVSPPIPSLQVCPWRAPSLAMLTAKLGCGRHPQPDAG